MRSLQGGDTLPSSYEPPPEAFEIQELTKEDIPIMPLVVKTLFVSNTTGENLSNVRKLIYKVRGRQHAFFTTVPSCRTTNAQIASSPQLTPSPSIAHFNLIGQEVPTAYVHIEQLIRQLRFKVLQNPRDGERPAFYTLAELKEGASKHLEDLNISETTLTAGLQFLHEVGNAAMRERLTESDLLYD